MKKIMFVCHGNICRSTMAEFLMKDIIRKKGLEKDFLIVSKGTSDEEEGNPVHYGTRKILDRLNISYQGKRAEQIRKSDYSQYDFFIGMDEVNRRNLKNLFSGDPENKVSCLLDYTGSPRNVLDPWYTHDFEATYSDITNGLDALCKYLNI